jgi:hypothetical protein
MNKDAPVVSLLNEIRQHFFRDLEVRNNAVLHWLDGHDIAWCASKHFLGFAPNSNDFTAGFIDGHNGRLVYNDAFAMREHQSIGRAQIDRKVGREKAENRPKVVSVLIHSVDPLREIQVVQLVRQSARRNSLSPDRTRKAKLARLFTTKFLKLVLPTRRIGA